MTRLPGHAAAATAGLPAAAVTLPGAFVTDEATLGAGNQIDNPDGIAIVGNTLYVVAETGANEGLFTIDLVTGDTVFLGTSFLPAFDPSTLTSVASGTLTPNQRESFTFTSPTAGLNFAPGDGLFVAIDNTVGAGTPNPSLAIVDADGFNGFASVADLRSPLGDGEAPALAGVVRAGGAIEINVSGDGDSFFFGPPTHDETGDFEVFLATGDGLVDVLPSVFTGFTSIAATEDSIFIGGEVPASEGLIIEFDGATFDGRFLVVTNEADRSRARSW
ncbi:MAG: hypothetical protein AAFV86_22340 [Pseudomonadota bacterium]